MQQSGNVINDKGRKVGDWKVEWSNLYYKQQGSYDWRKTRSISDKEYYDIQLGRDTTIRSEFGNHVILQSPHEQCFLEIECKPKEWIITRHQYGNGVHGYIAQHDLSGAMASIKNQRQQTLSDLYHAQEAK
ncbi:hypothetical protein [Pseudodesulfovibrio sediminis]|uniref:SH3 domain-containing protein n=1 Tax=Pseudodesulfovibrio sediminis TaxID=2810563 RepID=A0ABM7P3W0_9BACT|nr:hypothetical protein [Pseudodesulfovibrio sediminis]BCS88316.1 hypothetical protein PSDVSF_15580 [Pseudodesulfovibrio sediminis]